jgi:hypothetical protein
MRRVLIPPLLAALVFLPRSFATPPPQGWEERTLLRIRLPREREELQDYLRRLADARLGLARAEAEPLDRPDHQEQSLRSYRHAVDTLTIAVRRQEEKVAWIERRLGISP